MPKTSKTASSAKTASSSKTTSTSRRPFRVGRAKTGLGLFATKLIRKGSFIVRYTGRMLPNRIADELDTKYLFEVNARWTVDGSSRKNIARYVNHSCRPNAEADVKKRKILITAIKTINPGDEITYNYGRDYFNAFIKERGCRCAACHQKKFVMRSKGKRSKKRKSRKGAK
jgi:SET domain-containing protein